jgi:type IV secretion system protein TrbL
VTYFTLASVAHAADETAGAGKGSFTLLDQFQDDAKTTSEGQMKKIVGTGGGRGIVTNTFFILATLELCWAAAIWAMEKDNLNALASEIIQKIMFISFFYMLMINAPVWMPIIVNSLVSVGQQTIGDTGAITPDHVIAKAFAIVDLIWLKTPLTQTDFDSTDGVDIVDVCFLIMDFIPTNLLLFAVKLVTPDDVDKILDLIGKGPCVILNIVIHIHIIIIALLATLVIVIAYTIIAFQLLCVNIESYVLITAGAVFLGLGGSRWTNQYASKLLAYTLTIGMRILVLLLILGLGRTMTENMIRFYAFDIGPLLKMMGVAVVQALLALRAPEMASALMTGQGTGMSAGGLVSSVQSLKASGNMLKDALQKPGKAIDSTKDKITKAKNFLSKADDKKKAGGSVKGL